MREVFWFRDRYLRVLSIIPAGFIGLAILGPLIVEFPKGYGPNPLQAPSMQHWFGTDSLGLDVFAELIWGTQSSLLIALVAGALAMLIGTTLGLISAYQKRFEAPILAVTDAMLALPVLPLMIVITALIGPSFWSLALVIGFLSWPEIVRVIRANALSNVTANFVDYSKAAGASSFRILSRGILPLVTPVVLLHSLLAASRAVIAESALSFLGLGELDGWSWGKILYLAQRDGVMVSAWWQVLFPSLFIFLFVGSAALMAMRFNDLNSKVKLLTSKGLG